MKRCSLSLMLIAVLLYIEAVTAETTAIVGATAIDATGAPPKAQAVILIRDGEITAIGRSGEIEIPHDAHIIDASGKYAIPGLMEGINLIWFSPSVYNLIKYEGRYHEIMLEAAQIALKNGLTAEMSTWFYYPSSKIARDMISSGEAPGARIYVGGNIIGFDGPFSPDGPVTSESEEAAKYVDPALVNRLNQQWEQGTGRRLMWMTPEEVRSIVREYLQTQDLDYVKYAVNAHSSQGGNPNWMFISFSPRVQKVIVDEAHRVGLSVQAHTMTVEGMDMAIDAGVDIITHGDVTGPIPVPKGTLAKLVEHDVAVGVFPMTLRSMEALQERGGSQASTRHTNIRNLIDAGVTLMLGTEAMIRAPGEHVWFGAPEGTPEASFHATLGEAHFNALQALEEHGMDPMQILKTATSNIAQAYRLPKGTLEAGKLADILILDANPLESAQNYRRIHAVIMDGKLVDREALPVAPILTRQASASNARSH